MKRVKIGQSILELTVGDITKQKTDAVVNAANKRLAPGGGVAGAIHRASGDRLWDECKQLGGCQTGEAKITKGYNLSSPYIIHTVGPVYSGSPNDPEDLASCYIKSIDIAVKNNLKSISFPALSTGYFGYPVEKAARIAIKTVVEKLKKTPELELVIFVLYNSKNLEIHEKILNEITKSL